MSIDIGLSKFFDIKSLSNVKDDKKSSDKKNGISSLFNNDKVSDSLDSFAKSIGLKNDKDSDGVKETKGQDDTKKEIREQLQKLQDMMQSIASKISSLFGGAEKNALQNRYDELNSQWGELMSQMQNGGSGLQGGIGSANQGAMSFTPTSQAEQQMFQYGQQILNNLANKVASNAMAAANQYQGMQSAGYMPSSNQYRGVQSGSYAQSANQYGSISSASNNQAVNTDSTSSVQTPVTQTISPEVAKGLDAKLGNGFSAKVEQVAANINCNPNDLLAMMYSESGINPHRVGYNGATGLIQFLPGTARGLGTSTAALKNMSAIQQMDYVEKFFMKNKKMFYNSNAKLDAGTMYALCFLPAYAKRETLCSRGSGYYRSNSGVDMNKDGKITKTDLAQRVAKKYNEMYKQYTK